MIKLTYSLDRSEFYANVDHIVTFMVDYRDKTCILLAGAKEPVPVEETPEQILELIKKEKGQR